MRRRSVLFLPMAVLAMGASQCAHKVALDSSTVFAMEANDATVVIEGCGSQPVVGYTYCRVREGDPTTGSLSLIAPPIKCAQDYCVSFDIYFPDGVTPSVGVKLPEGQTRAKINFKDLVKRDTFQKSDRGFWYVVMTMKFVGLDNKLREVQVEGEIRMRVLSRAYVPLHESMENKDFVWDWSENGRRIKMTTAGRAWAQF